MEDEMKDESDSRSMEGRARAYIDFVENRYRETLSSDTKINAADRKGFEKRLRNFRSSFTDFAEFIERMRPDRPNSLDFTYALIQSLISASVLLGSAGGALEEARNFHFAPIRKGAVNGGLASGKARRMRRDGTWGPLVKDLANKICRENPLASQDTIVTEIESQWKSADVRPPGTATLKQFIAKMQKSGELPRRKMRRQSCASGRQK